MGRTALRSSWSRCDDDGVTSTPRTESGVGSNARVPLGGPIVVGLDSSSEARRGLLFAADLAESLRVELVVVHAFGLIGTFGSWRSGVEERERQVTTAMVDEWCAPLAGRRELTWQWRCVQGSAVEGILRTADEVDAGFVVVGSHGAGSSSSAMLGSTSQDIVRHSQRPVVVIPPPDNHRHRRGGAGAVSDVVADA